MSGSVKNFVRLLKHFPVTITDSRGFEQAQACAGGVPLNEVELPYCASRRVPGLYITGEILDADGRCGGYNLHWAWATGMAAGESAARKGRKERIPPRGSEHTDRERVQRPRAAALPLISAFRRHSAIYFDPGSNAGQFFSLFTHPCPLFLKCSLR